MFSEHIKHLFRRRAERVKHKITLYTRRILESTARKTRRTFLIFTSKMLRIQYYLKVRFKLHFFSCGHLTLRMDSIQICLLNKADL